MTESAVALGKGAGKSGRNNVAKMAKIYFPLLIGA